MTDEDRKQVWGWRQTSRTSPVSADSLNPGLPPGTRVIGKMTECHTFPGESETHPLSLDVNDSLSSISNDSCYEKTVFGRPVTSPLPSP